MDEKQFKKYIEFYKNSNKANNTDEYRLEPIINVGSNIIEFGKFSNYLNSFTLSYKVIKDIKGNISLFDILNHYKVKVLSNKDLQILNEVKLEDFKVISGLNTDLKFVCFKIANLHLNYLNTVFKSPNRTYHKYKKEFSKSERSLLWKLKNNDEWESNHKDWVSESEQLDLNGEKRLLPLEEPFKNQKQHFESEYEFTQRMKKEKWSKIQKDRKMRSDAIKSTRLWRKLRMPRLPRPERKIKKGAVKTAPKLINNGCLGFLDGKLVSFYKPACKKMQKQKIKPVERVFWIKPEDNYWFEKKEKHLW